MRRPDADQLLAEIIEEATGALRKKNFQRHVAEIHRRVHILEYRMKRFEEQKLWSRIDTALEKTKDEV